MKGLARILESIIASIILLVSLAFFFTSQIQQQDDIHYIVQASDMLVVMDKNGMLSDYVKNNDINSMNTTIRRMLSGAMDFSVEVNGLPNPIINLGCNCTSTQLDDLRYILGIAYSPFFTVNGRTIQINSYFINISSINEETNRKTNILFIFGYRDLITNKKEINNFLERGGTVFMFSSLTGLQVNDGMMNETFGLKYGGLGSGPYSFSGITDLSRPSYQIAKYYDNISELLPQFSFRNQNLMEEDWKTVVIGTTGSSVKVNTNIANNGRGRTIWFADFDYFSPSEQTNATKQLMKAAILWASGERFKMDVVDKNLPKKYITARYISTSGFGPFEIAITMWRIFQ
ncbi:MAG: hypothetical protein V1802_01970 [Candidatus Aenigmatarchaeota archaeon]